MSTTQQEWLGFSVSCSAKNPQNLYYEETNCQHSHWRPLTILLLIAPQGSTSADSNGLSPVLSLRPQQSCSSQWRPEIQDPDQQASSCSGAWSQSWLLSLADNATRACRSSLRLHECTLTAQHSKLLLYPHLTQSQPLTPVLVLGMCL